MMNTPAPGKSYNQPSQLNISEQLASLLEEASNLESSQQFEAAIQIYRNYLDYQNNNPWVYAHLAECLRVVNQNCEALEMASRAIELDATYGWAYTTRGSAHLALGEYGQALTDFKQALVNQTDDAWVLERIGETLANMKRDEEAAAFFEQAIGMNPTSAWSLAHRGLALKNCERYEESLLDLDQALQLNPQYSWAHLIKGQVRQAQDLPEQALAEFNLALEITPNLTGVRYERGLLYLELNDFENAMKDFDYYVSEVPENEVYHFYRGKALVGLNRKEDALQAFQDALKLNPEWDQIHTEIGILFNELGSLSEAKRFFKTALKINPESTQARSNLALTYRKMGKYKNALTELNRVIRTAPEPDAWFYAVRGEIYYLTHDFQKALADYNHAIELKPDYTWALTHRGQVLAETRRKEEAVKDFTDAIEIKPDELWGRYQRAELYKDQKQYNQALSDYFAVLDLDPMYIYALRGVMEVYDAQGAYDRTDQFIQERADSLPSDPKNLEIIGSAYESLSRLEKARACYEQVMCNFPEETWALKRLAVVLKNLLLLPDALEAINRYIRLKPKDYEGYAYRGMIYRNMRRYQMAIQDYDHAQKIDKDQGWVIANRGYAYYLLKKFDQAMPDYLGALELGYQNAWIWNRLGEISLKRKNLLEALNWFGKSVKKADETDDFAFWGCGLAYGLLKNEAACRENVQKAIQISLKQEGSPCWNFRNRTDLAAYYFCLGDVQTSLSRYKLVLDDKPPRFLIQEALYEGLGDIFGVFPELSGKETICTLLEDYIKQTGQQN